MLILKTIEEEALECRTAFSNTHIGDFVLHCHHERLLERLTEPAENRIAYILSYKHKDEQALRLRLFRPLLINPSPELVKARATREKAYTEWDKARAEWNKAGAK